MTSTGKHAKALEPSPKHGKHAGALKAHRDFPQLILTACLIVAVIAVPFTFNRVIVANGASVQAQSDAMLLSPLPSTAVASPEAIVSSYAVSAADESMVYIPQNANEPIVAAPAEYNQSVPEKYQNDIMAGGCELVSLDIVLEAMGHEADINEVVADHLNVDGHFATGYSGDPYSAGGGYPSGITEAANSYLEAKGLGLQAHDLTGISFAELAGFVSKGYPVLVWTTMGYESPEFSGAFDDDKEWYNNEHCVVLYGFENGEALISDPLEGKTSCAIDRFMELFEACGSMAAIINDKDL